MNDNSTVGVALAILRNWQGARILPVNGKYPAWDEVPHGSSDASDDPEQIAAWFTGTNYGVAVTGVLAIDGDDLDKTFDTFPGSIWEGHSIQGNPERQTFIFAQPDKPFGDGRHPGGEVKGAGYIVLPPSPHDDAGKGVCAPCVAGQTHEYRWLTGDPQTPLPALPDDIATTLDLLGIRRQADRAEPADELPPLWLTLGQPCRTVVSQVDLATIELTADGAAKHPAMTVAVLRLLRLGEQGHAGVGEALGHIRGVFIAACEADSEPRGRRAPHEFYEAALGAVGRIEADGLTPGEDVGCCGPVVVDSTLDDLVFGATPLLGHIRHYARAYGVGPWPVLGSTLARAVAEVPPHVRLPPYVGSDASANLYVALVDNSGAGKSASHKAAADAFTNMMWARQVPNGTGEGLIASFVERTPKADLELDDTLPKWRVHSNPAVLMYVDEIGQLQVGAQRQGASIEPILRSMWNGEHVGTNNADPDRNRNLPPHSYRLTLVAGVQPELAGGLLGSQATSAGTAQRWTWLPTNDPFAPDVRPDLPTPWEWAKPNTTGHILRVEYPDHVRAEVEENRRKVLRGIDVTEADRVKAHAMLARMKLAAALAILHGTLTVDDLMWDIAGAIMEKSDRTRDAVIHILATAAEKDAERRGWAQAATEKGRARAVSDRAERVAAVIARKVDRHADDHGGCTRKCITRAVGRDGDVRDAAIEYALEMDWITVENGDDTTRYVRGSSMPR